MRLSHKSRAVLEFLLICGEELLEALPYLRSGLLHYGGWSSDRAFDRQLKALEEKGWVHMARGRQNTAWIGGLTETGDGAINDDIRPEAAWAEPWDGEWTFISFDLPAWARDQRRQLDAWLRKRRFGHLQGSLWLTHRTGRGYRAELESRKIDPAAALLVRGRCQTETDPKTLARAAWNFTAINEAYDRYVKYLASCPVSSFASSRDPDAFASWFGKESHLWRSAFSLDPFLPSEILPAGYRGKTALARRRSAYAQLLPSEP